MSMRRRFTGSTDWAIAGRATRTGGQFEVRRPLSRQKFT